MGRDNKPDDMLADHGVSSREDSLALTITGSAREICYAAVAGAVGVFFLIQSTFIESSREDLVGPQSIPLAVSGLIIALALLQIVSLLFVRDGAGEKAAEAIVSATPEGTSGTARMAMVMGLGVAYVWLFSLVGYLVSTALVLGALLVVFGNRKPVKGGFLTLGAALTYYIVFIHFMGIQDSIGWHLDLSSLGLQ